MRVLIGGVGYRNLRDLSLGPALVERLQGLDWPAGVEVEDLSFGPIAIMQRLEEEPGRYDRIIFTAAVERGREPGSVTCYAWDGRLPPAAELQERIGEAVMGVISLDNLLMITQHFGVLPSDVRVVEVEPEDTGWGPGFTPRVEAALESAAAAVRRAALEERSGRP